MKKYFLLLLFTALMTMFIVWFFINYSKNSKLIITSVPNNINITIGSNSYKTPKTIRVKPGRYNILAFKNDYSDEIRKVEVNKNESKKVLFKLNSVDQIELIKPLEMPPSIANLPYQSDNFMIQWSDEDYSILISPILLMSAKEDPMLFFSKNWSTYENNGKDALRWLDKNGLNSDVRAKNKIDVVWWANEYWPTGKNITLNN